MYTLCRNSKFFGYIHKQKGKGSGEHITALHSEQPNLKEQQGAVLMNQFQSSSVRHINSFEELKDAIRGAQREVIQLEPGRVRGHLTHLNVGGLPIDSGAFSHGMRGRGVLSDDRITIGMLTGCTSRVTHRCLDVRPGDVIVTPPGEENERRYYGGASYAVISLSLSDIRAFFGGEPRLSDVASWRQNHFPAASQPEKQLPTHLQALISRMQVGYASLTDDAAEFWKRSIIAIMTANVVQGDPVSSDRLIPSAQKIVRLVEDYLSEVGKTPVHISTICSELNVSRRTLHRSFHDSLGIGPVKFLQHRRLCCIRSALRHSDSRTTTIQDVALRHGFLNVGRFAGYYHSLFDEYPSETLRKPHAS